MFGQGNQPGFGQRLMVGPLCTGHCVICSAKHCPPTVDQALWRPRRIVRTIIGHPRRGVWLGPTSVDSTQGRVGVTHSDHWSKGQLFTSPFLDFRGEKTADLLDLVH